MKPPYWIYCETRQELELLRYLLLKHLFEIDKESLDYETTKTLLERAQAL